jgi:hypothetical protein
LNWKRTALAGGLLALAARAACAGPAAYVHTPIVEYGEREIELKWGRAKLGDGTSERQAVLGLGMGVRPWWFTEVNVGFEGASGRSTRYEAIEWENVFQLTETGRYPLDLGLLLEVERPRDHAEGWELKYGPLLQAELGRVQLNGNAIFERHLDAAQPGETELLYEWQVKYRWRPALEFGAQGFGELGRWDHWAAKDAQSHLLGPAVFGRLGLGGHDALRYDAAYLVAASPAAPDHTLRFRVEYEF